MPYINLYTKDKLYLKYKKLEKSQQKAIKVNCIDLVKKRVDEIGEKQKQE